MTKLPMRLVRTFLGVPGLAMVSLLLGLSITLGNLCFTVGRELQLIWTT